MKTSSIHIPAVASSSTRPDPGPQITTGPGRPPVTQEGQSSISPSRKSRSGSQDFLNNQLQRQTDMAGSSASTAPTHPAFQWEGYQDKLQVLISVQRTTQDSAVMRTARHATDALLKEAFNYYRRAGNASISQLQKEIRSLTSRISEESEQHSQHVLNTRIDMAAQIVATYLNHHHAIPDLDKAVDKLNSMNTVTDDSALTEANDQLNEYAANAALLPAIALHHQYIVRTATELFEQDKSPEEIASHIAPPDISDAVEDDIDQAIDDADGGEINFDPVLKPITKQLSDGLKAPQMDSSIKEATITIARKTHDLIPLLHLARQAAREVQHEIINDAVSALVNEYRGKKAELISYRERLYSSLPANGAADTDLYTAVTEAISKL